ncbi:MAG: PorV/PorQ family protein [Elusimicrobia bacterium]|nr:PorV/PorQ family protein [Elusimicrobiota bacterium]
MAASLCLAAALSWSSLASHASAAPGTRTPEFLRIGLAPRPVALGESYAALADDVHALAYNPAGLAFVDRQELSLMHNIYVTGVHQDYGAYVLPTRRLGSLAVSANQARVAPFAAYDANDQPLSPVSADDLALSGAYAVSWREFAVGVGGKHLRSRLAEVSASGSAWDAGALWRLPHGFRLGGAILHMGRGLRYERERAPLPTTGRAAGAWKGPFLWPGSSFAASLEGSFQSDRPSYVSAGAEFGLLSFACLRVGYNGGQSDDIPVSWGAGFKIPFGRLQGGGGPSWTHKPSAPPDRPPTELLIDYAFLRLGELGITHRMSITLRFGRPRDHGPPSSWEGYEPVYHGPR